jgi:hypothetical protein
MIGDRDRCLAAGMDDYVAKPVRLDDLAEAIARWARSPGWLTPAVSAHDATPAGAAGEQLDPAILLGLQELDAVGGGVYQLVETYLRDTSARLTELQNAVEAGDPETVARIGHALRGSSGNLGATTIVRLCVELEAIAASPDLTVAASIHERITTELGGVGTALRAAFPPPS